MDKEGPKVGAKARRRWIKAPQPPDDITLERLRARFRTEPRIVEAWLIGSGRGWLFVSETIIRAHSDQAVLLYSRR